MWSFNSSSSKFSRHFLALLTIFHDAHCYITSCWAINSFFNNGTSVLFCYFFLLSSTSWIWTSRKELCLMFVAWTFQSHTLLKELHRAFSHGSFRCLGIETIATTIGIELTTYKTISCYSGIKIWCWLAKWFIKHWTVKPTSISTSKPINYFKSLNRSGWSSSKIIHLLFKVSLCLFLCRCIFDSINQ